ncbi:hypothetical protein ROLI_032510 [Roseobacter fucihabitans]|uniref:SnoaL-like domain-containing protein n=1 Tax=Roseobacter fucihabitans TaxID=1537242 RepID=A0ABZ2BY97_9RHOB|nr:hypothetical protein [Roseobacter litoralis]MBC6965057.1 hypothetical protein [Roseobacter litoralis]
MTGDDAKAIYQETLDVLSGAVMCGDTDMALARIKLPHLLRTLSSETIVETKDDLITELATFVAALKGQGTTNLVRLVVDAEFLSDNYIAGHHMTHTLRDATPVMASYASRMVLARDKNVWKVLEVDSMLNNLHWPIYIPRVRQDAANKTPPPRPQNDIRSQGIDPLTFYQRFIDALSLANNQNDFELYCSHLMFPHSSHTEASDTIISCPEDVRPFFDMLQETLRAKGCDRLERRGESAEFISNDLICGYHSTEMMAGDVLRFGPVRSRMVLQRIAGRWHLKSVTYSLQNSTFPYNEPVPSDALVTLRTIQERTRL